MSRRADANRRRRWARKAAEREQDRVARLMFRPWETPVTREQQRAASEAAQYVLRVMAGGRG